MRTKLARSGLIVCTWIIFSAIALAQDNINDGEFSYGATMRYTRSEIDSAIIDGKIYTGGGLLPFWEGRNTWEVYDIDADEWSEIAQAPIGLHHYGAAALDGKFYVSGGWSEANGQDGRNQFIFRYDPETDAWDRVTEMPEFRAAHVMEAVGDKLYIIGGVLGAAQLETDAVWSYNPEDDECNTQLTPMPTAREHVVGTVLDGLIYVHGGRKSFNFEQNNNAFEVYDPATDQWTELPRSEALRSGHTISAVGGMIYITGGEIAPGRVIRSVERYDPETQNWITLGDLPRWGLHGVTSVGYEGQWYIIGGTVTAQGDTTSGALNQLLIFTPEDS